MKTRNGKLEFLTAAFLLGAWGILILKPSPTQAGTLSFSQPQLLLTIPWADGSNHGVPPLGPEWLLVDGHGHFLLESNLDFAVYSHDGKYAQTLNPIDKTKNFYGFTSMEALPNGALVLLARLESPQEQWGKDNYEEHSKPGAHLIALGANGQVQLDKELADPDQPHSNYYVENGTVYSVHDDGTFRVLESTEAKSLTDRNFGDFASFAYNLEKWRDHLKSLPVFHSGNRTYHDTKGMIHEVKEATSSLMGHTLVEGIGPVAERNGVIYFQVVCDKNQDFINSIFVEDTKRKEYGLVELMHSDQDLDMAHGHTVFVDQKGDVFEGVGKKDGYRIYEWKINR